MNLKSLRKNKTYDCLPKVENVVYLWINDYWDGPINGMCELDGNKLFFEMIEEAEDEKSEGWYRKFGLIELSKEQFETESYWNELFCEHVGTHYNFTNGLKNQTRPKDKINGQISMTIMIMKEISKKIKLLPGFKYE